MDAIELLLTRSSNNKLTTPAPSGKDLETIIKAGLRAPDHANLSPYRFIVVQGQGLDRLSKLFETSAIKTNKNEQAINKAVNAPYRAPMIIIGICQYTEHEKVPRVEQIATTACAIQNMQMAAFALGYNGIWRTGSFSQDEFINKEIGLGEQDEIIGFLYLGTPESKTFIKKEKPITDNVEYWGS